MVLVDTYDGHARTVCVSQRVQLECHSGIRAPKTIYSMAFRT